MCGRYSFDDTKDIYEARKIIEDIASRLGSDAAKSVKTGEVFPSEAAAVVAQSALKNGYQADVMHWGYPVRDSKQLIINARSETIFEKGMFKRSIAHKKCLIPCTGFFEWKSTGNIKEKYLIRPEGQEFFYLAGLYDCFDMQSLPQNRYVILTAPANEAMISIHSRMPLIVQKQFAQSWFKSALNPDIIKHIYDTTCSLAVKHV